jgi:hypothetical protein
VCVCVCVCVCAVGEREGLQAFHAASVVLVRRFMPHQLYQPCVLRVAYCVAYLCRELLIGTREPKAYTQTFGCDASWLPHAEKYCIL